MDIVSGIQHGYKASRDCSEIKEEKMRAVSGHGCNELTQILPLKDTPKPLDTLLSKRKLEKVISDSQIDNALSVTEQTVGNNAVSTLAQAVNPAKRRTMVHAIDFLSSRMGLSNAKRIKLEKLDSQHSCLARITTISGEVQQLRPVTILHNGVPILLYRGGKQLIYNDSHVIAITLDPRQNPSQASYKSNVCSSQLAVRTKQLKKLSNLQQQIDNKLQEHSERTSQPVYLSATSGKLKVEGEEVCFKKPKKPNRTFVNPALRHNETLVAPFAPSDVQSVLVTKTEFMLHLDQFLTNKSAYEEKHGLIDLPITVYDEQTGERIHCYESQLFKPEGKKDYFEKVEILRSLLMYFGINPYNLKFLNVASPIKALQGASPEFLMNVVLNLSSGFLKYFKCHKNDLLNIVDNPENKEHLKTLCKLLSDGVNLAFTVNDSYSHNFFIKHVIERLDTIRKEELSKDLIESDQQLLYILLQRPEVKNQVLRNSIKFAFVLKHLQPVFWITVPEYVNQSALDLQFLHYPDSGFSMDRNLYLYCAGYVLENMNDLLFEKIIYYFIKNCLWPDDYNYDENDLHFKKNCLNILLNWKTLNQLEPKILGYFKEVINNSYFQDLSESWRDVGVDLTPILSLTRDTEEETEDEIRNQLAHFIYNYHIDRLSDHLQSEELNNFPELVKQANIQLQTLPDHLKAFTLPKSATEDPDFCSLFESLKKPFAQPQGIPDINDSHQATRAILDRYYRTLGPDRVVDIQNLDRPARSHLHGSGHALRVAMNIRLLMQLLERFDLADLSLQQKQLLDYAAIYHDAAAEGVNKDREVMASAGYFRRDMIHNCPAIYKDDILAIAEAMEHIEDDIHHEENAAINPQQRLYRRLLRFADRLDSARCMSIPEDFPNFENTTDAGKTAGQFDAGLLDIDDEWLNNQSFRKTLVSCIHGLLDLAAVSGGATQDHRSAKSYIKNYQLNPDASEKLNRFFEKTPKPLKALEDLMDDNVRRFIAQRAGLTTCGDPEHRQCDPQQEHQRGVVFGYTRYIHNRYHDLVQVEIPEMQLWEKLAVSNAHQLLSTELQSAINGEVQRLKEVGIKRNIGNPSQETLAAWEAQQFLKTCHGLKVVAESKLREVIPAAVEGDKVNRRNETILMLKACRP